MIRYSVKCKFVKKNSRYVLPNALDISSPTTRVAPEMLEALAILLAATVK